MEEWVRLVKQSLLHTRGYLEIAERQLGLLEASLVEQDETDDQADHDR